MMQLPAGATGFFEAGTFREPIQRGEFLQLVYQLARESRCTVEETDTSLCGKNFYAAQIVRNSGTEILFINAYTGHLACSDCWEAQPLRFTAPSAMLAALLPPSQLLSPSLLERSINVVLLDALAPAEQEQLRYWQPNTIGEILFNFWD